MEAPAGCGFDAAKFRKLARMFDSPFHEEADKLLDLALKELRQNQNRFCDDRFGQGTPSKAARDECAGLRYDLKQGFARIARHEISALEIDELIDRLRERYAEIEEDAPDADDMPDTGSAPFAAPPPAAAFDDFVIPSTTASPSPAASSPPALEPDSAEKEGGPGSAYWREIVVDGWMPVSYRLSWLALLFFVCLCTLMWSHHPPFITDLTNLNSWAVIGVLLGAVYFFYFVSAGVYQNIFSGTHAGKWIMDRLWSDALIGAWVIAVLFFGGIFLFSHLHMPDVDFGGIVVDALIIGAGLALLGLLRKLLPKFGFVGLSLRIALLIIGLFVCYLVGFHETPWNFLRGAPFPAFAQPVWPVIIVCILAAGVLVLPEVTEWFRAKTSRLRLVYLLAVSLVVITVLAVRNPVVQPVYCKKKKNWTGVQCDDFLRTKKPPRPAYCKPLNETNAECQHYESVLGPDCNDPVINAFNSACNQHSTH